MSQLLKVNLVESPEERIVLQQKKEYIEKEEAGLMSEILRIQQRTRFIFSKFPTLERKLLELRRYKPFAMNRLNKVNFKCGSLIVKFRACSGMFFKFIISTTKNRTKQTCYIQPTLNEYGELSLIPTLVASLL